MFLRPFFHGDLAAQRRGFVLESGPPKGSDCRMIAQVVRELRDP